MMVSAHAKKQQSRNKLGVQKAGIVAKVCMVLANVCLGKTSIFLGDEKSFSWGWEKLVLGIGKSMRQKFAKPLEFLSSLLLGC